MNTSSFKYLIGEGGRNLRANRQMSLASIGVLMACMLLIGGALLFSLNINSLMGYVEGQNEMVAFMESKATEEEIQSVREAIEQLDNVASSQYVSKEAALEEQMGDLGDSASLLDGLIEDNPLPPSFRIKVKDLERLEETRKALEAIPHVYQVNAATDVVSILLDISQGVNVGGLLIVCILSGASPRGAEEAGIGGRLIVCTLPGASPRGAEEAGGVPRQIPG